MRELELAIPDSNPRIFRCYVYRRNIMRTFLSCFRRKSIVKNDKNAFKREKVCE